MKSQIRLGIAIIICSFSTSVYGQDKFSDFFKLVFYPQDSTIGFYTTPDSLINHSQYSGFAKKLWAFNLYLYTIYSNAEKEYQYLNSFIPDSNKIKAEHERLLNEDLEFQTLFNATIQRKFVPDITIDSILMIISRFSYLHRMGSDLVIHMCATINGLDDLTKSIGSPYYNAFGFMVQHSDECSQIIKRIKDQYREDIDQVKQTLNEEKIIEIRSKIYESMRKDPDLRELVIREYQEKKDYLNLKILY